LILSGPWILSCGSSQSSTSGGNGSGGSKTGGTAGKASGGSGGAGSGGVAGSAGGSSAGGTASKSDTAATGGSGGSSSGSSGLLDAASGETGGGEAGGTKIEFPMAKVFPLFTAADVPAKGPSEAPDVALPGKGSTPPTGLPGKGIAQHPMIFVGEGYHRIQVVIDGKVVWHYDTKQSGELDDIWMLSNGNILYAHADFIEEITPKKEVVFHYDAKGEIHTCQPIGLDKVLFAQSQAPKAHAILMNKKDNTVVIDHEINSGDNVHVQCRRFRQTGRGTYVAAYLGGNRVVEMDKDFKEIWSYAIQGPWSGVPLKNGNVIIQQEGSKTTFEITPKGTTAEVVWQAAAADVVPAGMTLGGTQTCERLSSGNTVQFGHGGTGSIQAIEFTADKKPVWILNDWAELGDATTAQFLDEPGYPEIPGDTNH
jgi:hypothetical protein